MYRTSDTIETGLQIFGSYRDMTHLPLESSVGGRPISALRLRVGRQTERRSVLLMAGLHARELLNPDLLIDFLLGLRAHETTDWVIDRTVWPASLIRMLLESLDIYFLPNANPDGREKAMTTDRDWRKNTRYHFRPYPERSCTGTDINRNFDFLPHVRSRDDSGDFSASGYHCDPTYMGPSAFFEPETRNVRTLLTEHPIDYMVDLHSAGELIMHPWGHVPLQTTDPAQNITETDTSSWNILPEGAGDYREYMPPEDLDWFQRVGRRVSDAIRDCRPDETITVDTPAGPFITHVQRIYSVQAIRDLYPVTGSSVDYAYARHIVSPGARKVYPLAIETGKGEFDAGFQPGPDAARKTTEEVHCGLLAFLQACVCGVQSIAVASRLSVDMTGMRSMRDRRLARSPAGRAWLELFESHQLEVLALLRDASGPRSLAAELIGHASELLREDEIVPQAVVDKLQQLLSCLREKQPRPRLGEALDLLQTFSGSLAGRRVSDIVQELSERAPTDCARAYANHAMLG